MKNLDLSILMWIALNPFDCKELDAIREGVELWVVLELVAESLNILKVPRRQSALDQIELVTKDGLESVFVKS